MALSPMDAGAPRRRRRECPDQIARAGGTRVFVNPARLTSIATLLAVAV